MILRLINNRKYKALDFLYILAYLLYLCFCFEFVLATANITNTQFLRDSEALLSNNDIFKIGFFSLGNSKNRYVGIWYNDNKGSDALEVVWVANRDNPLNDSSGVLKVSDDGNLHILNAKNRSFWSTNVSHLINNNTVAQLQGNGNLVLLSGNNIVWESFEHLTDSLLPTPSLTIYEDVRVNPMLRSWKNASDPSSGRFSVVPLQRSLLEFFIIDGDKPYWRSGPWNGFLFLGVTDFYSEVSTGFKIIDYNDGTLQLAYSVANQSILERFVLNYDGQLLKKRWNDGKGEIVWHSKDSECQVYGKCGPFGSCDSKNSPICSCLKGFEPRNVDEWSKGNWTNGCVRRTPLQCGSEAGKADKFLRLKHMKVPDFAYWRHSSGSDDCERLCSSNCLCLSYAYYTGIGCMVWNVSLIDIQQFSVDGADLFIRLARSELDESSRLRLIIILVVIVTAVLVIFLYYLRRWMCQRRAWRKISRNKEMQWHNNMVGAKAGLGEFQDLPSFKFEDLEDATNNFSEFNKLGRGGFGTVYKGKLQDGQEVAVKRLSRASG